MNPLEGKSLGIIRDLLSALPWRSLNAEELEEAQKINPNRAMRRAYQFGPTRRLTGPGYTRAMRKGRTQRERS
jgi:hypothetical protein